MIVDSFYFKYKRKSKTFLGIQKSFGKIKKKNSEQHLKNQKTHN